MEMRIQPHHPTQEKIDEMLRAQNRVPVQFTLYTGNAGNGKSELLARHILFWFAWTELRGTYEDCYSNLHVKTPDWWEGRPRETKNLEISELAKSIMAEASEDDINNELNKMHDCMIGIDELQNWADRQNWMATKSRVFNYILMQRRHQHFHIAGTIQNRQWVDLRTNYQIDFEVNCRSMHRFKHKDDFADWERLPGQYVWITIKDLSGLVRPYSWYEDHYEKSMRIGPMWPIWECYSTYQNQDVYEPWNKLVIKGKKQQIDPYNNGHELSEVDMGGTQSPDFAVDVCAHVLDAYLKEGREKASCEEFRDLCKQQGLNVDPRTIGRILKRFNVVRVGSYTNNYYDLTNTYTEVGAA